jgi:CHAT domain-containing protein
VAPLVRPLITAGVPAVIGSSWDVGDDTAAHLLVSFHRHYRNGNDAAVALQSAQVEMLGDKNPLHHSVLAWAAFQVIGHASSPFEAAHQP